MKLKKEKDTENKHLPSLSWSPEDLVLPHKDKNEKEAASVDLNDEAIDFSTWKYFSLLVSDSLALEKK